MFTPEANTRMMKLSSKLYAQDRRKRGCWEWRKGKRGEKGKGKRG